jgi:hypothetical protein
VLPKERPRRLLRKSNAFPRQVELVGVTRFAREAGEAVDICAVLLAQRQESLEAQDALQGLRAVTEGGHEAPPQLTGGDEEIGGPGADVARLPRL